jgi:hypothetical protein
MLGTHAFLVYHIPEHAARQWNSGFQHLDQWPKITYCLAGFEAAEIWYISYLG